MSLLKFLGLGNDNETRKTKVSSGDTETMTRIASELEALPQDRARYLAAFAYILGRAAHADSHVSAEETRSMTQIVKELGHLPEAQAVLVVEIAKSQVKLFGGTDNFLVSRSFKDMSSITQRVELLECVFAVLAADHSITAHEEVQARQISKELGLRHQDFIAARAVYQHHLKALKGLRKYPEKHD